MSQLKEIRRFWISESENCGDIELLRNRGWSDVQFLLARIKLLENTLNDIDDVAKYLKEDSVPKEVRKLVKIAK